MGEAIIGLAALTAMEIVLGIDNIVFISIVTGRLPEKDRQFAWRLGLGLAMLMRILLLFTLSWVLGLTDPVFNLESLGVSPDWIIPENLTDPEQVAGWQTLWEHINEVSWRDIIMFVGGLFLVAKSVLEIHHEIEGQGEAGETTQHAGMLGSLMQILVLDVIFSLDSVITAVGMISRDKLWVMIAAVILSIGVMVLFASRVGDFIQRHPTLKMLALSFLILIGVMLIADGLGTEVNKGYIYFAMAFALVVEILNLRIRLRRQSGKFAHHGSGQEGHASSVEST
jgi:predicted tellurium resistance membrane protein TerC